MELDCSGIATTLRTGQFRVRITVAVGVVSSERSDQLRGPDTLTVNGKRGYISGVERPSGVKLYIGSRAAEWCEVIYRE